MEKSESTSQICATTSLRPYKDPKTATKNMSSSKPQGEPVAEAKKEEPEEKEVPAESSAPAEEKPKKKRAPRKKKEEAAEEEKPKKKEKPLSKLARKRNDERYFLNGKGRLVSKKKSENGKKNVQSRAIKIARKLLGLSGRMVLLGKGAEGKALVQVTKGIREALKGGKSDEEAEVLHTDIAKKILDDEKKSEESAAKAEESK